MKQIFILILVITHTFAIANKKFIIETDKSISELILINKKSGVQKKLIPQQTDNTNFTFEANELDGLFLKSKLTIFARIYSVSEKIASAWHPVKTDVVIPVLSFFQSHVSANIELTDFYIKTFQTNPLTDCSSNLRMLDEDFFYNSDFVNFIVPQNLNISWKNGYDILELCIFDKTENKKIYSSTNYSDTILYFNNIDHKLKALLKESNAYVLILNVVDSISNSFIYKINFQFNPFCFTNTKQIEYFLTPNDFYFSWFANEQAVNISIYDNESHLIYHKEQCQEKSLSFKVLESDIVGFKKRKKYILFLESGQNKISKEFYVLLN